MNGDSHGDMGFAEAIVSMMAVAAVIGLYLVFAATSSVVAYDPLEGFDADALEAYIADGIEVSESYMFMCLGTMDIRGMSVSVSIPHFDEKGCTFSVGSITDLPYSQTYIRVLDYDNGRKVPAVIEVIAYG